MRLKQYLTEEESIMGRSKHISMDKAIDMVRSNCKETVSYYKKEKMVITRSSVYFTNFLYVEPSKFTRTSFGSSMPNYYTLLMDNLKAWSKYPKRSKSICCSAIEHWTKMYGKDSLKSLGYTGSFCVFPFDGAKIGVCPEPDVWGVNFTIDGTFITLYDFAHFLYDLLKTVTHEDLDKDYKKFNNFVKDENDEIVDALKYFSSRYTESFSNEVRRNKNNVMKTIESIFVPRKLGFTLSKVNRINERDNRKEVWTDAKSVLVALTEVEDLMENL
ncbi:MAG: hypothetical protein ACOC56_00080 [Atribacterota bacterium]